MIEDSFWYHLSLALKTHEAIIIAGITGLIALAGIIIQNCVQMQAMKKNHLEVITTVNGHIYRIRKLEEELAEEKALSSKHPQGDRQ